MDDRGYRSSPEEGVLAQIQEGMKVVDREEKEIGTVKEVYFGEANESAVEQGRGPAYIPPADPTGEPNALPDYAFGIVGTPNDDPGMDLILKQMKQSGYIVINTSGLFASDRFALAEQIESVAGGEVRLSIDKDRLIERR